DPQSAYGGIVCLNRRVDRPLADAIAEQFAEVVFAPGYDDDALEALCAKRNLRILDNRERRAMSLLDPNLRQVLGGMLVQDRDYGFQEREEMQVVSARHPTEEEWQNLL